MIVNTEFHHQFFNVIAGQTMHIVAIITLVNQLAHLAIYGQLGTKLAGTFT